MSTEYHYVDATKGEDPRTRYSVHVRGLDHADQVEIRDNHTGRSFFFSEEGLGSLIKALQMARAYLAQKELPWWEVQG